MSVKDFIANKIFMWCTLVSQINFGDVHGSILFNLVWRMEQNSLLRNLSYMVDIVCCYMKDRLLLCIKKLCYQD